MLNCVLSTSHVTVTHTHNTDLIMDGSYSKTTFLLDGSHINIIALSQQRYR